MNSSREWRPSAPLQNIQLRARILAEIRAFFSARGVLEVETPLLSASASTDPHLESFSCHYLGPYAPKGQQLYLQTSPEFAMKRLLAAGSGPIYQICKAFRNGEAGHQHNPEFSMLEWYRPGLNHLDLMDEVELLVSSILAIGPARRIKYRDLFLEHVGLDPETLTAMEAKKCLEKHGISVSAMDEQTPIDDWLTLILTHLIEPALGEGAVFVYDFPVSQAMLARVSQTNPPVAERFELYINGIELANGFHELADPAEQQRRFELDLLRRRQQGLAELPMDDALLDALNSGLPGCAGVALGIDRLLMLAAGENSLSDVLAFPIDRC